ncbi:MerR family transcriptional regulator [Steroidobacter flavus]|uniref:MerR family transcriptional regulator n=1 Tax=Steroidobacter flavus TaxID=1842136 RepID=A0ABV8T1C7_9GAMM
MNDSRYTIGELARISGVAVRRIRFYSDEGLLPPLSRSTGNYRIYSDADVARLQLIRTLREAGLGLEVIGDLLARRLSIRNALELRLQALEAELTAKRRIADCIRTTLACDEPTEADLRRLWTMTTLTQTQVRAAARRLLDTASAGKTLSDEWKERMLAASTPELPAHPTPQQIDAWNEIGAMLTDETFIAQTQAEVNGAWPEEFDAAMYAEASDVISAKVRQAIASGESPTSSAGEALAREWLDASARAMKREPNRDFLQWHLEQYRQHHARSVRYQELLAILRGDSPRTAAGAEWLWIHQAMSTLFKQ